MRSEQAERAQGRRAKSADYKLAHPSNAHGVAHAVDMQFLAIEPVHDHRNWGMGLYLAICRIILRERSLQEGT
jgi:hypothetical protein